MIERDDIYLLSQNSNWSESGIKKTFQTFIYNSPPLWTTFLKVFFLSLGVGFVSLAVVFFFAFNWSELHKFAKIGLIEGAMIVVFVVILFSPWNDLVKNILITSLSLLVGVLFGVFGQIYQTGANAYDFFLGWTICISIWVFVSSFPPLWILYIVLVNTTIFLFFEQTLNASNNNIMFLAAYVCNLVFLGFSLGYNEYKKAEPIPRWFVYAVGSLAISIATVGVVFGIFSDNNYLSLLVIATIITYLAGLVYGIVKYDRFFIASIAYSFIVISSASLIKISDDPLMFLFIAVYIVFTVWLATHLILFRNRTIES